MSVWLCWNSLKPLQLYAPPPGYKKGELEGKNVSILMPPPYSTRHNGYMKAYQTGGAPRPLPARLHMHMRALWTALQRCSKSQVAIHAYKQEPVAIHTSTQQQTALTHLHTTITPTHNLKARTTFST